MTTSFQRPGQRSGSTSAVSSQIDLPRGVGSGLKHAIKVLEDVDGIGFTWFDARDVVRHPLVKKILHAYELHAKLDRDD